MNSSNLTKKIFYFLLLIIISISILRTEYLNYYNVGKYITFVVIFFILVSNKKIKKYTNNFDNRFTRDATIFLGLMFLVTQFVQLLWAHPCLAIFGDAVSILFILFVIAVLLFNSRGSDQIKFKLNHTIVLVAIFLISLCLRTIDLSLFSPYNDEYLNLVASKRFFLEGDYFYPRGSYLTYLGGQLFNLFGQYNIVLARFISAMAGSLSVLMIYLILQRFNKYVALISSFLMATAPLVVGYSRVFREYSTHLFLELIFIYLIISLIESFKKKKKLINLLGLFLVIGSVCLYYFYVERIYAIAYFFIIMIIYIGTVISLNFTKVKKAVDPYRHWIYLSLVIFVTAFIIIIKQTTTFAEIKLFTSLDYESAVFNPRWNSILEPFWYSGSNIPSILVAILFFLPIFYSPKNKMLWFSYLSFFVFFVPFAYILSRYFAVRYLFYTIPFLCIIFGYSIYYLLGTIGSFKATKKYLYGIFLIVFLLIIFNPLKSYLQLNNFEPDQTYSATQLIHYDITSLFNFLEENGFDHDDVVVSNRPEIFVYYLDRPFVTQGDLEADYSNLNYDKNLDRYINDYAKNIYSYYLTSENVKNYVENNESGYIISSIFQNRRDSGPGLPLHDFFLSGKPIKYLGLSGRFDIYKW